MRRLAWCYQGWIDLALTLAAAGWIGCCSQRISGKIQVKRRVGHSGSQTRPKTWRLLIILGALGLLFKYLYRVNFEEEEKSK